MIIEIIVEKEKILLDTGDYYFSPRKIDKGTEVLLSEICFESDDKVLDLGCVTVLEKEGYVIFIAEKRKSESKRKEKKMLSKKLRRKYGK